MIPNQNDLGGMVIRHHEDDVRLSGLFFLLIAAGSET